VLGNGCDALQWELATFFLAVSSRAVRVPETKMKELRVLLGGERLRCVAVGVRNLLSGSSSRAVRVLETKMKELRVLGNGCNVLQWELLATFFLAVSSRAVRVLETKMKELRVLGNGCDALQWELATFFLAVSSRAVRVPETKMKEVRVLLGGERLRCVAVGVGNFLSVSFRGTFGAHLGHIQSTFRACSGHIQETFSFQALCLTNVHAFG
jgi:hypothetical protein